MKLYLDSAEPRDIEEVREWGLISGVTTNPSLYAAQAKDFTARLEEILAVSPGDVFTQVIGWHEKEGLKQQARWLAAQSEKIIVKLPMSNAGLQALKDLKHEQSAIRIAITAVASVGQAMLCGMAGADVVALFNGPLDTVSDTPVDLVTPVRQIYTQCGFKTQILSACRFPRGVGEYAAAGSDMLTMRKEFMTMLYQHPFTEHRMRGFLDDWKKAFGNRQWPTA